jgi:hypothetical protein
LIDISYYTLSVFSFSPHQLVPNSAIDACSSKKALEAINNGDLEFLDINIADMDPQDIRVSVFFEKKERTTC